MQPQIIKSTAETAAGIGLLFTPYWSQLLTDIGFAASIMAQISGAIIGLIGVCKIVKSIRE